MLRVSNGKCVRRLGLRAMGAAKARNGIAILAIALTATLFTSLFTIAMSLNDGFQCSNFRQVGGYEHGGFKYLTEEQFHELRDDPLIKEWGVRRVVGLPSKEPFHKTHVEALISKKPLTEAAIGIRERLLVALLIEMRSKCCQVGEGWALTGCPASPLRHPGGQWRS